MRIVIINQARMTSTRLPGKVLKEVMEKPLLEYQIERLKKVKLADELVIATTVNPADQPIIDLCRKLNIAYYRGSEEDVLSRYYEAAKEYRADAVVRVTSDCPLIDPVVIDLIIDTYIKNSGKYDYISNTIERTYPRGMDTEILSFAALEEAHKKAVLKPEREHVTLYIYSHPEKFKIFSVKYKKDESKHRWTVDTKEDFKLVKTILERLYPYKKDFTMEDCLELIEQNPDIFNINQHIKQKAIE
ncbi:glycosyltransferase family protein [Thermosyntropha sp.]|uniref:glycosyltransferase family protein n=1 Tax=Thermosyntropha sp. TaxID=2740820 RepID=UPI0025E988D7|nr:glycosyltransferase family protein [Thermosyntropha sp.]MBO8158624.1 glycosyltransferase family protein [Thermosyntropha sp.]